MRDRPHSDGSGIGEEAGGLAESSFGRSPLQQDMWCAECGPCSAPPQPGSSPPSADVRLFEESSASRLIMCDNDIL